MITKLLTLILLIIPLSLVVAATGDATFSIYNTVSGVNDMKSTNTSFSDVTFFQDPETPT